MNNELIKIGDKLYKEAQVFMLPTEDITNVFIKGIKHWNTIRTHLYTGFKH